MSPAKFRQWQRWRVACAAAWCVALFAPSQGCGSEPGSSATAGSSQASEQASGPVRLPQDEGPHAVPLEWWYYTGHLKAENGDAWGFLLTFFKQRSGTDLYLGNFAVTDHQSQSFYFAEKPWFNAAEGTGYALDVAGWRASGADGHDTLSVSSGDYALELDLTPLKAAVLHGINGITGSGPDAAHYYSWTRLAADGTLTSHGKAQAVTGLAWMDHEWFDFSVKISHLNWDWFSIQLDDSTDVMLGITHVNGQPYAEGTWIDAAGKATRLTSDQFSTHAQGEWTAPGTSRTYPMGWTVDIPGHDLHLQLSPVMRDQELHDMQYTPMNYWEGEVTIGGTSQAKPVHGEGYVEMTGYGR